MDSGIRESQELMQFEVLSGEKDGLDIVGRDVREDHVTSSPLCSRGKRRRKRTWMDDDMMFVGKRAPNFAEALQKRSGQHC